MEEMDRFPVQKDKASANADIGEPLNQEMEESCLLILTLMEVESKVLVQKDKMSSHSSAVKVPNSDLEVSCYLILTLTEEMDRDRVRRNV